MAAARGSWFVVGGCASRHAVENETDGCCDIGAVRDTTWVAMHPNLALHIHPVCQEFILALQECHAENKYLKYVGACNDVRLELDRCLKQESRVRRELNLQAAREEKERVRERMKERGAKLD
ncbi:COX assembly mitochondrial protein 2-like [Porphyridium purpureum]|uniref:COX assembly mitochondrial protein n=1 Tax=Porphyridium purpureum TaxID=35688 RepID=A0A5J4YYV1_PORPP|nr:COX assembly mitochondrial protein 2-like [Porphyridium purpureum]|eukprot:POR7592..scf208_2